MLALFFVLVACAEPDREQSSTGYIEVDWVYVAAPQSGWLNSPTVERGARVEPGSTLFELDSIYEQHAVDEAQGRLEQSRAELRNLTVGARPAEIRALEASLAEAQARVTQARLERDRVAPLVRQGVEPKERGDEVLANYQIAIAAAAKAREDIEVAQLAGRAALQEAARATVATAEAQSRSASAELQDRTVLSRVSGSIEEVFHHQGEFVSAGSPVVAILPEDGLKVRFFVSQRHLPELHPGKPVQVYADGLGVPVKALVRFIASDAEFTPPVIYSQGSRDKLVFLVEAQIAQRSGLRPGLPVDVAWM